MSAPGSAAPAPASEVMCCSVSVKDCGQMATVPSDCSVRRNRRKLLHALSMDSQRDAKPAAQINGQELAGAGDAGGKVEHIRRDHLHRAAARQECMRIISSRLARWSALRPSAISACHRVDAHAATLLMARTCMLVTSAWRSARLSANSASISASDMALRG